MVRPLPGVIVLLLAAAPAFVPDRVHGVREGFPGADRGRKASVLAPRVARADPVDPRLARVRAYEALGADGLKRSDGRVRVGELISIIADSTAPKEVRAAAAAAMTADVALVNDVDLSLGGRGFLRPRLLVLTRVEGLLVADDDLTRTLAQTVADGLIPGAMRRLAGLSPEELRAYVARSRANTLAALEGPGLEEIVRRRIEQRVRPRGARFADVDAWIRREAAAEGLRELARLLALVEPGATVADAKALFAGRARRPDGWSRASFGPGFFAGDPPPPPPRLPLPKPPPRDAWWAEASTADRMQFAWATFVETSGIYEVIRESSPCSACDGTGRQTRVLSGGFRQEWVCVRCGGQRCAPEFRYR